MKNNLKGLCKDCLGCQRLEDEIHIVIPNEYNKMEVMNEFKNEGAINVLEELLGD